MTTVRDNSSDAGEERRRSYRINDHVTLSFRALSQEEMPQALAKFDEHRQQLGLKNRFVQEKESRLPILKQIEQTNASVASYLRFLEQMIDALANQLATPSPVMPQQPTHDVTLSAHGIRFSAEHFIPSNSPVELRLQLFPSCICLLVYATVVVCKKVNDQTPHRAYAVAAEFTHIHAADREIIIKHIHQRQMLDLRASAQLSRT